MKLLTKRNLDHALFTYGLVISAALFFGALQNLDSSANLISFIFFLPVSLYFLVEFLRYTYRGCHRFLNLDQPKNNRYFQSFTLPTFFDQGELTFLLTLFLFALAISLALFKSSLTSLQ